MKIFNRLMILVLSCLFAVLSTSVIAQISPQTNEHDIDQHHQAYEAMHPTMDEAQVMSLDEACKDADDELMSSLCSPEDKREPFLRLIRRIKDPRYDPFLMGCMGRFITSGCPLPAQEILAWGGDRCRSDPVTKKEVILEQWVTTSCGLFEESYPAALNCDDICKRKGWAAGRCFTGKHYCGPDKHSAYCSCGEFADEEQS